MVDILCSRIRRFAFSTRAARSWLVIGCTPSSMGLSLRMDSGRSLCCAPVTPVSALARKTRRFIPTRLPSMSHGVDHEIRSQASACGQLRTKHYEWTSPRDLRPREEYHGNGHSVADPLHALRAQQAYRSIWRSNSETGCGCAHEFVF